ncbi:hypothetical protein L202_01151 [Cryptococcus amylolentus CBS 6039]|uniref:Phosducin thioredoxin-like domain-containing protein n=2 Tax=Cryptococcus amylolentus TaxID=104669 RepID=A0A1E3I2R2_9TREE|nr:hypothetical protein L202_01151 [Cryptococcus amylolentus CBS 6039]ODN82894.1 hypothetical protein L202_01151 [Cryptococcus amylolentus CBS 6039]ODO10544.1 hypothetical protein I350_01141 [Cryptococcus amylolentus CBS 6273]
MDALEKAALDGSLFQSREPPSTTRADDSGDRPFLGIEDEKYSFENDESSYSSHIGRSHSVGQEPKREPRGLVEHGGPQTGAKGVIEDKKASEHHAQAASRAAALARGINPQSRQMTSLTVHEEAELAARQKAEEEDEELNEIRRRRRDQLQRQREEGQEKVGSSALEHDMKKAVKGGGLQEIGSERFLEVVERQGWGLSRCDALSTSLLHLSLNVPDGVPISLYRARATALRFSLVPPTPQTVSSHRQNTSEDSEMAWDEEGQPLGVPDPDVLPTLLAYKDGELEKTWIRVDWDVGKDGIEGLLRREGILPSIAKLGYTGQAYGEESDDDD